MKHVALAFLALICSITSVWAGENVQRFAVVIGRNDGGPGRTPLKYARADAEKVSDLMIHMGGLDAEDERLLIEPDARSVEAAFGALQKKMRARRRDGAREELFVYYSGHSDEEGLLLGNERVSYRQMRKWLAKIPSDLSVVILDSCASGAWIASKGGLRKPPFLSDSLSRLKGKVVLASSSENESSQESDRIRGSYFTHYLLSGLRGAADLTYRQRVTLEEAYQYAYAQTLAATEKTLNGPQHASYSMELTGSGELVVTDVRKTSSKVIFPKDLHGRFSIRDSQGRLVAELDKATQKPMAIGLDRGEYAVVGAFDGKPAQAKVSLEGGGAVELESDDFKPFDGAPGPGPMAEVPGPGAKYVHVPTEFSVAPHVSTNTSDPDVTFNNFHLSLLYAAPAKVSGFSLNVLGITRIRDAAEGIHIAAFASLVTDGTLAGAQFGGLYNYAKEVDGAQFSGAINSAEVVEGAQLSGMFNVGRKLRGLQNGLVNVSDDAAGVQSGFFNRVTGKMSGIELGVINSAHEMSGGQVGVINFSGRTRGVQLGLVNVGVDGTDVPIGLINLIGNLAFRASYAYDTAGYHQIAFKHGSEIAHSIFQYSFHPSDADSSYQAFSIGQGFDIPIGDFFVEPEVLFGLLSRLDRFSDPSGLVNARLLFGYHVLRNLSVIAGPAWNYAFAMSGDDRVGVPLDQRFETRPWWLSGTFGVQASW